MCIPKVGFGIPQKVPPFTVNALCLLDQKRPALKKMLKRRTPTFLLQMQSKLHAFLLITRGGIAPAPKEKNIHSSVNEEIGKLEEISFFFI